MVAAEVAVVVAAVADKIADKVRLGIVQSVSGRLVGVGSWHWSVVAFEGVVGSRLLRKRGWCASTL